jgi:UrcA family protein
MKAIINTAAAIALGTLTIAASPVAAKGPSMSVSFADLNLSSDEGTAIFDRRIERAVESVCGGEAPRHPRSRNAYNNCIAQVNAAVQPERDLAIAAHREGRLAANAREVRVAAN